MKAFLTEVSPDITQRGKAEICFLYEHIAFKVTFLAFTAYYCTFADL